MAAADPTKTYVAQTFTHASPLISCRFDPTGKFVFAGAEDSRIWRWDLAAEKETKVELAGHDSWVRSFGFSTSGDVLVTGGYDGRLVWWPAAAEKPEPTRKVDAHQGWLRALSISPDGQLLATCGNDQLVKIWRFVDGTLVRELAGHEFDVWNVAYHPNGKDLVSGDLKSNFIHWDAETGAIKRKFQLPVLHKYDPTFMADHGGPHSMAFSRDGALLAAGGITNVSNAFAGVGNPAIVLVDWESGKEKVTHLAKGDVKGVAWGTVVHPDGFTIGASGGSGGGHLFFWKFDQKEEFHKVNLGNTARDLAIHPDGIQLATPHYDKKLRISRMADKPV